MNHKAGDDKLIISSFFYWRCFIIRIWHWKLLPYLPDKQFCGQLHELVAIMHDWRDKGRTNHILINKVMKYPKAHLLKYFAVYSREYVARYGKHINIDIQREFLDFCFDNQYHYIKDNLFNGWHNNDYLKLNMCNLLEKHLGVGSSRVTDEEWNKLCEGYKLITGTEFVL